MVLGTDFGVCARCATQTSVLSSVNVHVLELKQVEAVERAGPERAARGAHTPTPSAAFGGADL